MHKKIIIFVLPALFLFYFFAYAQQSIDFNLPGPAGAKLEDSKNFTLGDKEIHSELFITDNEDVTAIAGYYKSFLIQQGFEKLLDEPYPYKEIKGQRLRFKKEDLAVDVSIIVNPAGIEITVAKYLQPVGSPSLEETKPSVKDSLFALPKEDVPGKDIPGIPRPPQSVRIVNIDNPSLTCAMYTTPLFVDEAVSFYNSSMVNAGWKMMSEVSASQAAESYERVSGKDNLSRIQSPFSDGENLSDVVKQSYVLFFQDSYGGTARITIMPNFTDKKAGSMVQVTYTEAKQ